MDTCIVKIRIPFFVHFQDVGIGHSTDPVADEVPKLDQYAYNIIVKQFKQTIDDHVLETCPNRQLINNTNKMICIALYHSQGQGKSSY